jgi:hypothetical protein
MFSPFLFYQEMNLDRPIQASSTAFRAGRDGHRGCCFGWDRQGKACPSKIASKTVTIAPDRSSQQGGFSFSVSWGRGQQ